MVSVFGLTPTPIGWKPTGIVAVTVMQPLAVWAAAVLRIEEADAAAVVVEVAGTSPVMATATRIAVRWASVMMSASLPGRPVATEPMGALGAAPGLRLAAA